MPSGMQRGLAPRKELVGELDRVGDPQSQASESWHAERAADAYLQHLGIRDAALRANMVEELLSTGKSTDHERAAASPLTRPRRPRAWLVRRIRHASPPAQRAPVQRAPVQRAPVQRAGVTSPAPGGAEAATPPALPRHPPLWCETPAQAPMRMDARAFELISLRDLLNAMAAWIGARLIPGPAETATGARSRA